MTSPNLYNYCNILLGLCKQLNVTNCLEIGVGPDAATADYILCNYWNPEFVYYGIDNDINPLAVQTLSKHNPKRYKIISGDSHDKEIYVLLPKFDIICVDGNHSCEGVFGDLMLIHRLNTLSQSGLILLHDTTSPLIQDAMELARKQLNMEFFNYINGNFALAQYK